ncbi:RTA1-domain-containing protein [Fomes fomentarius]|nr:RTA1-domain-containing protein [Fomes fomentarius]
MMMSKRDDDVPIIYDAQGHLISPFYGYLPTRSVCYIFIVLFAVSVVLHFGQAIRSRAWWLLPTVVLAAIGEVIGWSARLWSNYSPLTDTPYLIQIVCTIIAPTPLIGAIFITFGRMSIQVGQQYSRLKVTLYSRIFLTIDIIALVVQSIGGGYAASADSAEAGKLGSNIMLAGIVFQLVSLTVFCILAAEYFIRYAKAQRRTHAIAKDSSVTIVNDLNVSQSMDKSMKQLAIGVGVASLFLYIRAIYRTIELADGFNGRIIQTEVYFNVLDGAMVVLAMYALNIFHPGRLLDAGSKRAASDQYLGLKESGASV